MFFTHDLASSTDVLDSIAASTVAAASVRPTVRSCAADRGNRVPSARFLKCGGTTTEERRWSLASTDENTGER